MATTRQKKPLFKVGEWVSFQWGVRDAVGQILEDRGPIGVGGRRLFRIQPALEFIEAFELPEADLKPAHRPTVPKS